MWWINYQFHIEFSVDFKSFIRFCVSSCAKMLYFNEMHKLCRLGHMTKKCHFPNVGGSWQKVNIGLIGIHQKWKLHTFDFFLINVALWDLTLNQRFQSSNLRRLGHVTFNIWFFWKLKCSDEIIQVQICI